MAFTRARRRLTALRLAALGVAHPAGAPLAAVRSLLALQAQDFAGALWAVGLRSGATRDEVVAVHEHAAIVRSWPLRGTLHLVAAEDLPWMLDLAAGRAMASAAGRHRQLELTAAEFDRAERVARRVLGSAPASRAELLAAVEADGVSTTGQRGAHLVVRLAQSGVVVLTGKDRFALLDDLVPRPRRLERDAALRELALRYLGAHGPATVRDLAWWAGLTLADARAGVEAARDELDGLELDGASYLHRPGLEPAPAGVHLLPGFDEYLLGYTDRSAPLAGGPIERVVPGSNGMFLATVVVNGEIVGTWRREETRAGVVVDAAPFRELPPSAVAGITRAARHYARFLGTALADR